MRDFDPQPHIYIYIYASFCFKRVRGSIGVPPIPRFWAQQLGQANAQRLPGFGPGFGGNGLSLGGFGGFGGFGGPPAAPDAVAATCLGRCPMDSSGESAFKAPGALNRCEFSIWLWLKKVEPMFGPLGWKQASPQP